MCVCVCVSCTLMCCRWCSVSYIFGLTAMLAGLLGVPLGSFLGQRLRAVNARADPLVCGAGMLLSMPFMLAGLFVAGWNTLAAFAVVFFRVSLSFWLRGFDS